MSDLPAEALLSLLEIEAGGEAPLYMQIYEQLGAAILKRQLGPGLRLPSIRELARVLEVSRNTVVHGYQQLIAEGYVEPRQGSGNYVSERLPEALLEAHFSGPLEGSEGGDRRLSMRSEACVALPSVSVYPAHTRRAFRYGLPALEAFPFDVWARLGSHHYRHPRPSRFDYAQMSPGYGPLREALAAYLCGTRALRCDPSQIAITTGAQQGIFLAAHLLLDRGEQVLLEEPGYQGAQRIFRSVGAELVPVPIDSRGFDIARAEALAPEARVAFVTPSRHHPLGTTMTLERRVALIDWAARVGGWIIEDDYDSAYRYEGHPLASLQGLDGHQRVLYVGTFSKVLFPALRLGYLVAPRDLVDRCINLRGIVDTYTPTISQRVLADFMEEGHFVRHLRKMRKLYGARRDRLLQEAAEQLSPWCRFGNAESGMSATAWLAEGIDDRVLHSQALERGVVVSPISQCYASPHEPRRQGLVFGYAGCAEQEIAAGVQILAQLFQQHYPA